MLNLFHKVLHRFKDEALASGYEMLLEADVSGWLFYLLLTQPGITPQQIHLDTRICNADGRFDIAIGPLHSAWNERPCIQPEAAVEVKVFPRIGFTAQQHRVHYVSVLERDLPKLGVLEPDVGLCAAMLLDGAGYLEGTYHSHNRREFLIRQRDRVAPRAHLFIVRLVNQTWQIGHEAPG